MQPPQAEEAAPSSTSSAQASVQQVAWEVAQGCWLELAGSKPTSLRLQLDPRQATKQAMPATAWVELSAWVAHSALL